MEFSRIVLLPFTSEDTRIDHDETEGVHAVQLRLDYAYACGLDWTVLLSEISRRYSTVGAAFQHPRAFSVVNVLDASRSRLNEADRYFGLSYHAVALGFEYCYVDLHAPRHDLTEFMDRIGTTRVVGSWHHNHNPEGYVSDVWQMPECMSLYLAALNLGCAVLHVTSGPARITQDNFDVVSCIENLNKIADGKDFRISAFNTGSAGRLSRVLNRVLTPVVCDADVLHFAQFATSGDPELDCVTTIREMQAAVRSSLTVNGLTFGSFGADISHSVAPAIHNAAFQALGLPHHYGIIRVKRFRRSFSHNEVPEFWRLEHCQSIQARNHT